MLQMLLQNKAAIDLDNAFNPTDDLPNTVTGHGATFW
jgi:hypothetical protein